MIKAILLTSVLNFVSSAMIAQAFQQGTQVLSAGLGIGSSLSAYSSNSQTPALSANYEIGLWEAGTSGVISLGGYVGFKRYGYRFRSQDYTIKSNWNYSIIGLRSAYHYTDLGSDQFDVYGGLMLSYNMVKYKWKEEWSSDPSLNDSYSNSLSGSVGFTAFVGGRYFFNEKLGVYAELGYGVSYLNAGVSFRF
jgi:hypothetical protein